MGTRKAMFAGSWYPDSATDCEREIRTFLKEGQSMVPSKEKQWLGGIVPHAGWYFSGSIACNVIYCLSRGQIPDVIALFGMHLHPNSNPYLMKSGGIETPFGVLPICEDLTQRLNERFRFSIETVDRFTPDNTIELQLPFIKYFFPRTQIVTIGVPPRKDYLNIGKELAKIADQQGLRLLVIGSTDLTHYGTNYGFTDRGTGPDALKWVREDNDRRIIKRMLTLDDQGVIEEGLSHQNACCAGAAGTAITAAKALGADTAVTITYATSFDKSPQESFVGYVGIVLG